MSQQRVKTTKTQLSILHLMDHKKFGSHLSAVHELVWCPERAREGEMGDLIECI